MKKAIHLLLSGFLVLMAGTALAQTDSSALIKKQKELEKNEKDIRSIQGKIDKKDRKMRRALKRADRKERKKEKHERRLRDAERKRQKLITDTSHAYLNETKESVTARRKVISGASSVPFTGVQVVADERSFLISVVSS